MSDQGDESVLRPIGPKSSGQITNDPLKDLPVGSQIAFASQCFAFGAPDGLHDVNNWEVFDGAVIALHFGSVSDHRILGSGVIVAPGIALAAWHVIAPEVDAVMAGDGFICSSSNGSALMFWRPRTITAIPSTDLAILTLEYASSLPSEFVQAVITTRTPQIGETVLIAGHRHHRKAG